MYEVGTAKKEITAFKKGIGMMGYGMHWNTVEDIETQLYARAYVFFHPQSGKVNALVIAEMAFVSQSVKNGVLKTLARKHPQVDLQEDNLMLSAQHTHSGPGGYNHYGLYNITIPGFVPEVYRKIVDGIVASIVEAWGNRRPAHLYFSSGEFPEDVEVGFNRSMEAYLRNPETKEHDPKAAHTAINREMTMLRIDGMDGEKIGAINWFGVHATSVHNDNHSICWDNKGYAADFLEREVQQTPGGTEFLGAFAQGVAGDVTPNYVWDKKKKWTRGPYEDDFESARHNGRLQYTQAAKIYAAAPQGHEISGDLDCGHIHVNFANVLPDQEFTQGAKDARTVAACHGVAFMAGTREGPGFAPPIAAAAKTLSFTIKMYEYATSVFQTKYNRKRIYQKYKAHGRKAIMIEAGERRILGTSYVKGLVVPSFVDPTIANFKRLHPKGWDEDKPWTPHVLPLQLMVLGDIALVGLPAEITTIAGKRLRKVVEDILLPTGIHHVILAPYSNSYCGYITTNEEYQVQAYEGGHTVFGQWTLAAFQTKLKQLAIEMSKKAAARQLDKQVKPPEFTSEELSRRSYDA